VDKIPTSGSPIVPVPTTWTIFLSAMALHLLEIDTKY
jgi:hypothetical protein